MKASRRVRKAAGRSPYAEVVARAQLADERGDPLVYRQALADLHRMVSDDLHRVQGLGAIETERSTPRPIAGPDGAGDSRIVGTAARTAPGAAPRGPVMFAPPTLWKLNVRAEHVDACIRELAFGTNRQPGSMQVGDGLVLQTIKSTLADPTDGRVRAVLMFAGVSEDIGESERYWGTEFKYLIHASAVYELEPFNLEDLGLSRSYSQQGMQSHQRIEDDDHATVVSAISARLNRGTAAEEDR